MNDNVRKWVEALRSGEYGQTRGQLAKGLGNERAYCCLGVACRLYRAEHPSFRYRGENGDLPQRVQDWLGLADSVGWFGGESLARRNDNGASFADIADIIERQPRGLFVEGKG